MNGVIEISKTHFDALQFLRTPSAEVLAQEVAWYEAYDRKLLTVIARFHDAGDYGVLIFARDERKVFRFHRLIRQTFLTKEKAYAAMMVTIEPYSFDTRKTYEKSPFKGKEINLFTAAVDPKEFAPFFQLLKDSPIFEAARNLITELALHFSDGDGNFIKDFQSKGFHSRLWELFLHIMFSKLNYVTDRQHHRPDFIFNYFDYKFAIEAVTVNESNEFDETMSEAEWTIEALVRDYMPIKFARTLTRKLQRQGKAHYWELDHVKDIPFIIALHDYHSPGGDTGLGSMTWSRDSLPDYLFGHRIKRGTKNELLFEVINGEVIPTYEEIGAHIWKGKRTTSGFFALENAQHVSAVLFANNATLSTFNRIGKVAGFGGKNLKINRIITKYDIESAAYVVRNLNVDDPSYEEEWSQSAAIYHNPFALRPLDPNQFPDFTHFFWDQNRKQISAWITPNYTVSASQLDIFIPNG